MLVWMASPKCAAGRKTKSVDEGLTIGQHVDLPLGGHVILEQFLLLFGERVGQCVPSSDDFIQSFRVLAVALETALAGANIAEVKIFQYQHFDTSSAVDEFVQNDLFCPVLDAVHVAYPFHLIGSLERFCHIFTFCYLLDE